MATDLKLYFRNPATNPADLYNAVYYANAIGDAYPGVYNITLQAVQNPAPNESLINLNQYGPTLESNELQTVIASLIDPASNEIFDSSIVASSGRIISNSVRAAMFGFAPAIRHDLTIDFRREDDPNRTLGLANNRLELIPQNGGANSRDYEDPTDLVSLPPPSTDGLIATGFKIDDGNPNQKINVTLKGLRVHEAGGFFFESNFDPGEDRGKFPDVGVMIDNYENLTINGMVLGPTSIVGNPRDPQIVQAQIINRPSGNLTLTGDIVVAPALNYTNSLAYNLGALAIDNANVRIFDKNSPEAIFERSRFGGAERAVGAINNLGTIAISNSSLFQEADNKVNASSIVNATPFNNSVFGDSPGYYATPNWRLPVTLEYLLSNSGSASISNSVIAGILRQQGSSTASLSLQNSKLGYGETPTYDNLFIDRGSYSVDTSTIDRISTAIRPSQLSNSVILSSAQPNVVGASDDIAFRQFLDPSRPSLFTASKENVGLLYTGDTGEFWRSTYDPAQLNPAVQAAVAAALQGSQKAKPTVTKIQLGFGTILAASEKQQDQSITAFTHNIPDGSPLTLQLNNKQYRATVTADQAAFTIPASDLAALPTGTASAVVSGLLNGQAIPSQAATFSVDGQTFAAVPHITAIRPSFGTVLEATEVQQAQTLLVTTTGLEAGRQLTLELDGASNSAISGGVVQANGEASFSLPVSVLASLNGGLHRFRVTGSNAAGTAAPAAELPFSADGAHNIAVTPHVLSIVPSFGAMLSALEATNNQSVVVTTENLNNGDQLQLSLYGNNYTASITNNSASFPLPAADLQALPSGTDFLTISGPISPAGAAQLATTQQSFTKDGTTALQPHILSITPAFGHVLDLTEAGTDQTVTVSTDNFGSSGSLTLSLAGKTYSPTSFTNGVGSFTLPAADLAALSAGATSLAVNGSAAGLSAPEVTYSVVVDKTSAPPLVPAITSIAPSFGAILDLNERNSAQAVVVNTRDIADNQILSLTLNGQTYNANTSANQASFAIPAADLQALPNGLSTLRVTPSGQNTPVAALTISSEAPALASTPHVLSIVTSFGAVLTVAEAQQQQTVSVSTEGVENNRPLVLRSSNGLLLRGTVNNNQAVFSLTPQQLQSLPVGLDSFSAVVANQAGVQAPAASVSFAVDGLATAALPHIDRITPAFGALLDSTEAGSDQQVLVDTTGFSNGDLLTLSLAGKTYSAAVAANGEANFTLPTDDLALLLPGLEALRVNGRTAVGVSAPELQQSFSIDGPAIVPHITDIDPSFGASLDQNEAAVEQSISVISERLANGQLLRLRINGATFKATVKRNQAQFLLPSSTLVSLPSGVQTLVVEAPGSGAPDAQQAFAVVPSAINGGNKPVKPGAGDLHKILGTPRPDELIGGRGKDHIRARSGPDRLLGRNSDDRLIGGRGHDALRGDKGDDLLIGGRGGDLLTGGTGRDTFRFSRPSHSLAHPRGHRDVITDFFANDRIDLTGLSSSLKYIQAKPFSGTAGELRYQDNLLSADLNGDQKADFIVVIEGFGSALSPKQLILGS